MAKFANQHTITVHSSSGREEIERPYGVITQKELRTAFRVLDNSRSGTPIMLYLDLATNKDGYVFDFSPAELEAEYGIAAKRWRSAFKELVKKGYLVKEQGNSFIFNSYPKHKDVTFPPKNKAIDKKQNTIADNDSSIERSSTLPPADIDTADDGDTLTPSTTLSTTTGGDSNNKDNKYIKEDNIQRNNSSNYSPSVIDAEIESLLDEINNDYGHWEDTYWEILSAQRPINKEQKRYQLRRVLRKLRERREHNMSYFKHVYKRAIERTWPQAKSIFDKGVVEHRRIELIVQEAEKAYKEAHNGRRWPWYWSVWVNGWNEELKEPNLIFSTTLLPLDVIAKQKHCLDGIPEEYTRSLYETNTSLN